MYLVLVYELKIASFSSSESLVFEPVVLVGCFVFEFRVLRFSASRVLRFGVITIVSFSSADWFVFEPVGCFVLDQLGCFSFELGRVFRFRVQVTGELGSFVLPS